MNYYEFLNINFNSNRKQIEDAILKKELEYHPDNYDLPSEKEQAENMLFLVDEARRILLNPLLRMKYNKKLGIVSEVSSEDIKLIRAVITGKLRKKFVFFGRKVPAMFSGAGGVFKKGKLLIIYIEFCSSPDKGIYIGMELKDSENRLVLCFKELIIPSTSYTCFWYKIDSTSLEVGQYKVEIKLNDVRFNTLKFEIK